jgi:hypothetical protein
LFEEGQDQLIQAHIQKKFSDAQEKLKAKRASSVVPSRDQEAAKAPGVRAKTVAPAKAVAEQQKPEKSSSPKDTATFNVCQVKANSPRSKSPQEITVQPSSISK